jgi:hypothetical protein
MAQRLLSRPIGFLTLPRTQPSFRAFSTVVDGAVDARLQRLTPPITRATSTVYENALKATAPRTSWTKEEITEIYNTSLIDLTYASVSEHDCITRNLNSLVGNRLRCTGDFMTRPPFRCVPSLTSRLVVAVRTARTAPNHPAIIPVSRRPS